MTLTIYPTRLAGTVIPPPSKSQAHRFLIAAALAQGESVIQGVTRSQDMEATLRCLTALGAGFARQGDTVLVRGLEPKLGGDLPRLDCGESGSTLRFLIPVALAVRGGGVFTGRGRLMERPQQPYFDIFREKGIRFEQKDGALTVEGQLVPGEYRLPGDVSSQFFTGLLYALPLLDGPSAIIPTTHLESMDYISMTCQALDVFGVTTISTRSLPPQYHVMEGQRYQPTRAKVEGDWSQAGFWYAAMALGNPVEVEGVSEHSLQGDKVISQIYLQMCDPGEGVDVDVSGCPDLVPALAAMAALRQGETRISNAGRLRLKESDRLAAVTQVLGALGADIEEGPDFLIIRGKEMLKGGATVDSCNDHRIAMMAAIAATRCKNPVTLTGADSVNKSYPDFWAEYTRLGGNVEEVTA